MNQIKYYIEENQNKWHFTSLLLSIFLVVCLTQADDFAGDLGSANEFDLATKLLCENETGNDEGEKLK